MSSPPPQPIWLIGMPGAGKSSILVPLTEALGMKQGHLDTDAIVAHQTGMSTSEIFHRKGEDILRNLESQTILRIAQQRAVIALGGGSLTRPEARQAVKNNGIAIYLRTRTENLAKRTEGNPRPPLLKETWESLLQSREPAFLECQDLIFDTDSFPSPTQAAQALAKQIQRFQKP